MAAVDLDLLLHHTIRLLRREEGMSADEAYDAVVPVVLELLAEDIVMSRNWPYMAASLARSLATDSPNGSRSRPSRYTRNTRSGLATSGRREPCCSPFRITEPN